MPYLGSVKAWLRVGVLAIFGLYSVWLIHTGRKMERADFAEATLAANRKIAAQNAEIERRRAEMEAELQVAVQNAVASAASLAGSEGCVVPQDVLIKLNRIGGRR